MTERSSPNQATKLQKGLFRQTKLIRRRNKQSWDDSYLELVAFRQKHGHCNVPHYLEDYSLARSGSRDKKRVKDDLQQDQIARLNQIGFNWSKKIARFEQRWKDQFQELKKYKGRHWDTKVPITDPQIGQWVSSQRKSYHRGTLCQDRREKLDEVGFIWTIHSAYERDMSLSVSKWRDMFAMLVEFHREHGHCLVPRFYKDNKLRNWVWNQRTKLKKGRIPENHKKLLDEIGFV